LLRGGFIIKTGEFVAFTSDELGAAEEGESLEGYPEWQKEVIKKADDLLSNYDDYRELPSKFDIHEYSIMERFCYSIEDEDLSRRLVNSIRGRGAFRYFKDMVHEYGIVDEWYKYREDEFNKIAIDWLDSHKIAYTEENATEEKE